MFSLPSLIMFQLLNLSSFFIILTVLRNNGRVSCRMVYLVIFHIINWNYMFLERMPQRWSALFVPLRHMIPHDITGDANLHLWSQWYLPDFPTIQLLLIPFPTLSSLWNLVAKSNSLLEWRVIKLHLLHILFLVLL